MTTTATLDAKINTTISGGGYTIDLTNLNGQDGSGLRIQRILATNPANSVGNVTVATGASNGRAIPASLVVPPGGTAAYYYNDYGVDIDATNKTLDVTGTNADVPLISVSLA